MGNVNARCHGRRFCGDPTMLIIPCVLVVSYIALFLYYRCLRRRHIDPDFPADHDIAALPRPLDPEILKSIPVIVCGESAAGSAECVICLNEIEEGEELRVLPNCNHEFHVLCIDRWFLSASTCPLCRAVVEMPDSDGKTPNSRPRPPMLMTAWASIMALVFSRWALIRDFIRQSRQGLQAEPDLELEEGPGTSRHPLPAPRPPPPPHS